MQHLDNKSCKLDEKLHGRSLFARRNACLLQHGLRKMKSRVSYQYAENTSGMATLRRSPQKHSQFSCGRFAAFLFLAGSGAGERGGRLLTFFGGGGGGPLGIGAAVL